VEARYLQRVERRDRTCKLVASLLLRDLLLSQQAELNLSRPEHALCCHSAHAWRSGVREQLCTISVLYVCAVASTPQQVRTMHPRLTPNTNARVHTTRVSRYTPFRGNTCPFNHYLRDDDVARSSCVLCSEKAAIFKFAVYKRNDHGTVISFLRAQQKISV